MSTEDDIIYQTAEQVAYHMLYDYIRNILYTELQAKKLTNNGDISFGRFHESDELHQW